VRNQPVVIDNIPLQQPLDLTLHVDAQLTRAFEKIGNPEDASQQSQYVAFASAFFQLLGDKLQFDNEFEWRADKPVSEFVFKDVPPGQYTLQASGNPAAYVASLTCGSINLMRQPLVIGPGVPACPIEAVIRDDLASLSIGLTPQAEAQMAAYGTGMTAFALIPVDNSLDLPFSGFVWRNSPKKVRIPPGSYLAFLFDGRSPAWREPKFQEQIRRLGTLVTLTAKDDKTVLLDFKPELDSPRTAPASVAFGRPLP
jgi:hypothetical protein